MCVCVSWYGSMGEGGNVSVIGCESRGLLICKDVRVGDCYYVSRWERGTGTLLVVVKVGDCYSVSM